MSNRNNFEKTAKKTNHLIISYVIQHQINIIITENTLMKTSQYNKLLIKNR